MRLLSVFVAALIMVLCFASIAEEIDVESMNTSELLQLKSDIEAEIEKRSLSDEGLAIKRWYDTGLGQFLPDPIAFVNPGAESKEYSRMNTDFVFSESICNVTVDDFKEYVEALKKFGYDENVEMYGVMYSAVKDGKYKVCAAFADIPSDEASDYMMITLDIIA